MDTPEPYSMQNVNNLIEMFNSRMNRIKEIYENGDILNNQQYIEDTEKLIRQIEDITGEYRTKLIT